MAQARRTRFAAMVTIAGMATAVLGMGGCSREAEPDAFGNVEAIDVVVAAEASGRILSFNVAEGQLLAADAEVGAIDAVQMALERDQLDAQRAATASRVTELARQADALDAQKLAAQAQEGAVVAQRAALQSQLETARRNAERTERLFAQQAATAQQRDQAGRDVEVLEAQITAQDDQIEAQRRQVAVQTAQVGAARAQRAAAAQQVTAAEAQVARAGDRLRRATIRNPSAGTVLVTYVEPGELVQAGQPLYKIADLTELDVRGYLTQPQLSAARIGQPAQVTFDEGDGRRTVNGTLTWISAQAEFTPTPIQTRDERANLVYAVKVRVANGDGRLKIGMPVDLDLDVPTP